MRRTAQACGRIALMVSTISHGCCSIVCMRADDNEYDQLSTDDGILTVHYVYIINNIILVDLGQRCCSLRAEGSFNAHRV